MLPIIGRVAERNLQTMVFLINIVKIGWMTEPAQISQLANETSPPALQISSEARPWHLACYFAQSLICYVSIFTKTKQGHHQNTRTRNACRRRLNLIPQSMRYRVNMATFAAERLDTVTGSRKCDRKAMAYDMTLHPLEELEHHLTPGHHPSLILLLFLFLISYR